MISLFQWVDDDLKDYQNSTKKHEKSEAGV
jgi:hypothetical protein